MLTDDKRLDNLFRDAVQAIDSGDVQTLDQLIRANPELVSARLEAPGSWLCRKIGKALDGFFRRPYLLWFVAEDPVRNGKLPDNVVEITKTIIDAASRNNVESLQEQLDYAIQLVAWSWIAKQCGVQIGLIDSLADAGASLDGVPANALVNGHVEAAAHAVARGAEVSLAVAMSRERWHDVDRLAPLADIDKSSFPSYLQRSMESQRRLPA